MRQLTNGIAGRAKWRWGLVFKVWVRGDDLQERYPRAAGASAPIVDAHVSSLPVSLGWWLYRDQSTVYPLMGQPQGSWPAAVSGSRSPLYLRAWAKTVIERVPCLPTSPPDDRRFCASTWLGCAAVAYMRYAHDLPQLYDCVEYPVVERGRPDD